MAGLILAGDIGGTNTRLAIFDDELQQVAPPQKFPTGNGRNLEEHLRTVLKSAPRPIKRACLAMAGPIVDGVCDATNIGRKFVTEEIRKDVGLDSLLLINDLVGNAAGIERLEPKELVTILEGEAHQGNCAVVSPGTGLGEGALIWDGRHHRPIPSEGGHSRFAPTTDLEIDLLRFMLKKQPMVIVEDFISGKGIVNLFDFFVSRGGAVPQSMQAELAKVEHKMRGGIISDAALSGVSDAAVDAMNLFVRLLAIEAASIAVKVFAVRGIFIGGGIPPKILPLINTPTFKDAFLTHSTMDTFLKKLPVRVILNDDTALEGAALYGQRYD